MTAPMSKVDSLKALSSTGSDKTLCKLADILLQKCDRKSQQGIYGALRQLFEASPNNAAYKFLLKYMQIDDIVEMQYLFATGVQIAANASGDYMPTLLDSGVPRRTASIASYDTETDDLSTLTPIGIMHYMLTKYADRLTDAKLRDHFLPKHATLVRDRIEAGIEEYRHMVTFKDPAANKVLIDAMKSKYGEDWIDERNHQQMVAHGTLNNDEISAFQNNDPAEIDAERFKKEVQPITDQATQMYLDALQARSV